MRRTRIKDVLTDVAVGETVTVAGWVRTLRTTGGGFSFVAINDGSCLANLQVVADGELPNYESEVVHLTAGSSMAVSSWPYRSSTTLTASWWRASEPAMFSKIGTPYISAKAA